MSFNKDKEEIERRLMTSQEKLDKLIDELKLGEQIIIAGQGGWELMITKKEIGCDFVHQHPASGKIKILEEGGSHE